MDGDTRREKLSMDWCYERGKNINQINSIEVNSIPSCESGNVNGGKMKIEIFEE